MATQIAAPLPASAIPGPEVAALAPFYRDWSWSGTIEAGGMGRGSPEMKGIGHATCRLIQGGLWYACDFEQEQRLADGTFVLTWQLHWVTGWDRPSGDYRASSADNNGPNLAIYRGRIESNCLIYESLEARPPQIRLTWNLGDAEHATWRNEYTLDGETWNLIEEYRMELGAGQ